MFLENLPCMNYILVHLDVPEQVQVANCAWKCQVSSDSHKPIQSNYSNGDAQDETEDLLNDEQNVCDFLFCQIWFWGKGATPKIFFLWHDLPGYYTSWIIIINTWSIANFIHLIRLLSRYHFAYE